MTAKEKRIANFPSPRQQTLLKRILKQSPTSKCWQATSLISFKKCLKNSFQIQMVCKTQLLSYQIYQNTPFVQVIHNGCYHWLWLSTYGCTQGEIFILVSKFNYSLSIQTKKQICALLHCPRHPGYYFTSSTADRGSWLRPFCNSLFTIYNIMQTKSDASIFWAIAYEKSYPKMSQK